MYGTIGRMLAIAVMASTIAWPVGAQTFQGSSSALPLINTPISNNQRVTLPGNTRPEATAQYDRGSVPDNFPLQHMMLQLKRSPAREQALETLIDQLHDPASSSYHQWLTPGQIGEEFGLASADLQKITQWLTSQGFQVNQVYPNGMVIDFSGNARQVQTAFGTAIHFL